MEQKLEKRKKEKDLWKRKNLCKRRAKYGRKESTAWQKRSIQHRRRRRNEEIYWQSEEAKKGEEIFKRNEDNKDEIYSTHKDV